MTLSTLTPETILTRTFQGGLLIAMPATLYALGGPLAIWSEGGVLVRMFLVANLAPSAFCAPAAMEGCVRTALLGIKTISSSNTPDSSENKKALSNEVRRTTGMMRAALFPVSGWAVSVQLPVNDYYVYIIPKVALNKTGTVIWRGAAKVHHVLEAIKFYDGVIFTLEHTVVPAYTHIVAPTCRIIGNVASGAISLLRTSLGMR